VSLPLPFCCSTSDNSFSAYDFVEFGGESTTTRKHHPSKITLSQARCCLAPTSSNELVFFVGVWNGTTILQSHFQK
jgi:hypothetical protein